MDINADLGESLGVHHFPWEKDLMQRITSISIACGFHSGDFMSMDTAVKNAIELNLNIGAHPGYPDIQGFGRRAMSYSRTEIKNLMLYQIGALEAFTMSNGGKISYCKPHGALYNQASKDIEVALGIIDALALYGGRIKLLHMHGSILEDLATNKGIPFFGEFFIDRAYDSTGNLVPRKEKNSVIYDTLEIKRRATRFLKEKTVTCITGEDIRLKAHSICIHGDSKSSLDIALALRQTFTDLNYAPEPF